MNATKLYVPCVLVNNMSSTVHCGSVLDDWKRRKAKQNNAVAVLLVGSLVKKNCLWKVGWWWCAFTLKFLLICLLNYLTELFELNWLNWTSVFPFCFSLQARARWANRKLMMRMERPPVGQPPHHNNMLSSWVSAVILGMMWSISTEWPCVTHFIRWVVHYRPGCHGYLVIIHSVNKWKVRNNLNLNIYFAVG